MILVLVKYYYKGCKMVLLPVLETKNVRMGAYVFCKHIWLISGCASIRSLTFYLLVHNFSQYAMEMWMMWWQNWRKQAIEKKTSVLGVKSDTLCPHTRTGTLIDEGGGLPRVDSVGGKIKYSYDHTNLGNHWFMKRYKDNVSKNCLSWI